MLHISRWPPRLLMLILGGLFILLSAAFDHNLPDCYADCLDIDPRPPISQTNPAEGWSVIDLGTESDPLAPFGRRPIDEPRIIPQGGNYKDTNRQYPHYGIDYTFPEMFLNDIPQPIYPIGPGVVTALHTCPKCWAYHTGRWGQYRTGDIRPDNNFGYGALLIVEHPYNEYVSFYSLYAHLREINVHVGQMVDSDTQLALLGASGDAVAPHVHMEIRFGLPGKFWGQNLSELSVMRRWLQMTHETPLFLLYAEHHIPFTRVLDRWVIEEYPLQVRDEP